MAPLAQAFAVFFPGRDAGFDLCAPLALPTRPGKSNLDGILAATERGFREECFLGTEGEAPSPHDGVRVTMRQQRCGHPEPGLPAADGEANNGKDSRFLAPRSLDKDPGTPQTSSKSITTLRASAHTSPLSRTPQSLRVRVTESHADAAPESQLAGVRAQEPRAQAHHTLRGRAPSARLGACGLPSGLRLHDDRVDLSQSGLHHLGEIFKIPNVENHSASFWDWISQVASKIPFATDLMDKGMSLKRTGETGQSRKSVKVHSELRKQSEKETRDGKQTRHTRGLA
ncbi:Nuclear pore complex protein Nup88 [Manis javanica]|nr:Nuclear pore complex protein Nup88 [Manis javanica]